MSEEIASTAGLQIAEGVQFFPEIQTVLAMESAANDFREDYELKPVNIDTYHVAPWGPDNLLPNHFIRRVSENDIVSANLKFNRDVCFGLGPKLIRVLKKKKGKIIDWEEVESGKVYDWFQANDIPLFVMQQFTDMNWFYNCFPELQFAVNSQEIARVRHREAVFSRWSIMNHKGQINWHYYCGEWDKNPGKDKVVCTRVLDEFDTMTDLQVQAAKKPRLIFPAYMPSPGKPYYSRPEWYSIFRSGWYDHSSLVPRLKKAILQNQLGVKYIIYIAPEYFDDICRKEGIDKNDHKAYKERVDKEKQAFADFLAGEKNANKTILATKQLIPTSNGSMEQKWIQIEKINNDLKGGEYIDDTESTANIICYAMGVHSALIGATPGKNSNTLGGSNARELYMMKQSLMRPVIDRTMRVLKVVKDWNKWDPAIQITIPEYIFTTLDQNKTGKEESTNTNV